MKYTIHADTPEDMRTELLTHLDRETRTYATLLPRTSQDIQTALQVVRDFWAAVGIQPKEQQT